MGRLLLGDDLALYEDGTARSVSTPVVIQPTKAELPYRDSRFVGRVLTVAADGTLTWALSEHLPEADGTMAGRVLAINAGGNAEWVQPIDTLEVNTTDGDGDGWLHYGPDDPPAPEEGSLFFVTYKRSGVVLPSPPATAPVLQTPLVSGNRFTLNWNAITGATEYEIAVDGAPTYQTSALTYQITLPENTSRVVKVRAHNAAGSGPYSNTQTIAYGNQKPPPIDNMQLLSMNVDTFGNISFQVGWAYTLPADFSQFVVTASAGSVAHTGGTWYATITSAPYSTAITVTVKARDTGGLDSDPFSSIFVTPDPPPPAAPDTPANLTKTHQGYASADFSWDAVSGATSYEYSLDGATYVDVGTGLTVALPKTLTEQTDHTFAIRAKNSGGVSAPSTMAFTTLPHISGYVPAYQSRTFGYDGFNQFENWSAANIAHVGSGILATKDNWATGPGDWTKAIDKNRSSVLEHPSSGYSRWVEFALNAFSWDDLEQIVGYWKWPGKMTVTITDVDGNSFAMGNTQFTAAGQWSGTITPTYTPSKAIAKVRIEFSASTSGSAPNDGFFSMQEIRMRVRQILQAEPIYNDP